MADIVNLKRAKKAKARRGAELAAASNRALYGTPKTERRLAKALREKNARAVDAHKRDTES